MSEILYTLDESILSIKEWEDSGHLVAGMTTRRGGVSEKPFHSLNVGFHVGDRDEDVLTNRRIIAKKLSIPLEQWVVGNQPHGNQIYKVQADDASRGALTEKTAIEGVDGLYTDERGILLVSMYADCVPLYFYAKEKQMVGIAHAGWRGTVANIAGKMVTTWYQEGIEPSEIRVFIGPSIGSCCYEVSKDVINEINRLHLDIKVTKNQSGKDMLDLQLVNKKLLMKAGVRREAITMSSFCTSCHNTYFYSHRKEKGQTGRMMAYIGLTT